MRVVSLIFLNSNAVTSYPLSSGAFMINVDIRLRSLTSLPRSISLIAIPFSNLFVSASILPFSAIKLCPANTRSVEDSPSPASA